MNQLLEHFNVNQEAILDVIRRLVERETKSREEGALNEIAHFVAGQLQEIGGKITLVPQPGYGTHLRADFDFGHSLTSPRVLVIGHLDTVWPIGTLAKMPFRLTSEGCAHGPGIFDMKSGIAIAMDGLRTIQRCELATKHPVTLLLTCDEEIGSRTSRALVEEEARRAVATLVLEPPIKGGIVKTGRKGIGTLTVRALGRAAHAGLDPAKGVNAIVELAHQTLRLASFNNYDRGVTVSVGVASGGTALNVVPAEATAHVDVRFWQPEDGEAVVAAIRGLEPVLPGARLDISGGVNRPPMNRSEKNLGLFEQARRIASEIGFELREQAVGGGSDGNFTSALGVPTLDGLGVDGDGAHADHEHIVLADIPRRATLLTELMRTV
jgi:glutamate carboxypeptidase